MLAQPLVHDVGVDAVPETDASTGGTSLAAFTNDLEFELCTVKPPLEGYGLGLARHRIHDLHRALYRQTAITAQDIVTGLILLRLPQ